MSDAIELHFRLRSGAQSIELPVGEMLIGRAPECGIALDDDRLSRLHAKIEVTPTGARLLDLGSRNGTFLNDQPVSEPLPLADGDVIRMGKAEFTVTVVPRQQPRRRSTSTTLGGATLLDIGVQASADNDVLAMMFKLGRIDEAEKILKARVSSLLKSPADMAPEHPLSASVVDGMLLMAEKTMDAAWLHRLLKVYVTLQWWLAEPVQQRFEQLVRALGKVGGDGLAAYLIHWSGRIANLSEVQKEQLSRLRSLATRPGLL
jgi:pSer/pThr/pTyr-binding forkhead associated (FHA) protein